MTNRYEKKKLDEGYESVIGCDEVGRGCLAGPVVAAAVILNPQIRIAGIDDSKKLPPQAREVLDAKIRKTALALGLGVVEAEMIDKINIHQATFLAMRLALANLSEQAKTINSFLFVDGQFEIPVVNIEQQPVVGGDSKILSIAAASIVAKVYRDNLMKKLHETFPLYNFAKHKGYGTEEHRRNILAHGLSPLHRLSFCGNFVS